jgi:hypothetical protein
MTKYYEFIDSNPLNIYQQEKIIKWSIFISSTVTARKQFPLLIFLRNFCWDQKTSTKTTGTGIYIMYTTPRK